MHRVGGPRTPAALLGLRAGASTRASDRADPEPPPVHRAPARPTASCWVGRVTGAVLAALVALGGVTTGGPLPTTPAAEALPACRVELVEALERLHVPGLAAGIIENGRLTCVSTAGFANLETGKRVTPDTLFAWASVSKTVTATALLMLRDEGRFNLDDPIDAHLPFSVRHPECGEEPITFRHLLTHTSSIVDGDAYEASYTVGDPPVALGDFLRDYLTPGGAHFDPEDNFAGACPGKWYVYSNVGAGLIGYLVEQISGQPFEQFVRERIFSPLGMTEAAFHIAGVDPEHVAMPYDQEGTTFSPHGHVGFPTFPDGGLRTSVPQLARFLAMMAGGDGYTGPHLLRDETVREMLSDQIPKIAEGQGLIWYADHYGARDVAGHHGSDPGTSSLMLFDPKAGRGVLLVANGVWEHEDGSAPEADALVDALFKAAESR